MYLYIYTHATRAHPPTLVDEATSQQTNTCLPSGNNLEPTRNKTKLKCQDPPGAVHPAMATDNESGEVPFQARLCRKERKTDRFTEH